MAVYSTNQNRQLYVATTTAAGATTAYGSTLANIQGAANLGKVTVGTDADGNVFINQNGFGGIVRSDLINPDSIMWANVSSPKDTQTVLKAYTLELKSSINSGNPIPGQDYVVRVNFRQMYGMSDEDIYQKYGAVRAKSAVKADFLKEMAYSLVKNFNRLYAPLVYVGLADASSFTLIKSASKDAQGNITFTYVPTTEVSTATGAAVASPTKLVIAEMSQVGEWALGTKQYTPVYFDIIPTTIDNTTATPVVQNVEWGTVSDYTSTYNQTVGNGYKMADLEYFCMGERGDQYRNVWWPKSIPTKYFVDPTKEYYCLDIHYAYQGTCEDIQKSEKTLTIIADIKKTIDDIIGAMGITDLVSETDYYADATKDYDGKSAKTVTARISGKADQSNG